MKTNTRYAPLEPLALAMASGVTGLVVGLLGTTSTVMVGRFGSMPMMQAPEAWNAVTAMVLGMAAWIAVWGALSGALVAWIYNAVATRFDKG